MAVFKYKAKDKSGKIKEGTMVAVSKKEAGRQLRGENLSPLFVRALPSSAKFSFLSREKIPLIEKANLARYLATMIKAGLPLTEALDVLCDEATSSGAQKILNETRATVQKGQLLSVAFARHPQVFDQVFLTLVKAGEESGTLEKSFEYLGKQLYADYQLRQKIKSTLAYPVTVTGATLALGISMLVFVVPRIAPVLLRLSQTFTLPPHTLFILNAGLFLSKNLLFFLGGMVGLIFLASFLLANQKSRKKINDFISRLPGVKKFYQGLVLARFNRTLSTLLKSGVPIIDALQVSTDTLTLPQYRKVKKLFSQRIGKGESLSEVLKKSGLFPSIMVRMVITGEKTGSLDKLLLDLATFYEEEISNSLKTLTDMIEPILMLVIGVGVGVIVVSLIAPIYSFVGSLSQSIGGG